MPVILPLGYSEITWQVCRHISVGVQAKITGSQLQVAPACILYPLSSFPGQLRVSTQMTCACPPLASSNALYLDSPTHCWRTEGSQYFSLPRKVLSERQAGALVHRGRDWLNPKSQCKASIFGAPGSTVKPLLWIPVVLPTAEVPTCCVKFTRIDRNSCLFSLPENPLFCWKIEIYSAQAILIRGTGKAICERL